MKVSSASTIVLRRSILWGSTWGVAVAVVEYLTFATIDNWGSASQLLWWLLDWVIPFWCLVGFCLVRLAHLGESLAGRASLTAIFFLVCLAASAALPPVATALRYATQDLLPSMDRFALETGTLLPVRANWATMGLYWMWVNLFYGSLLMTACTLVLRSERMRYLLYQNAMAHGRTESLLDAERLRTLQSQIDPTLLLDSMQELELRYRHDPERAERLLESLVEFLRFAMHGLRTPTSTLDAELKLARAFAQLQRERGIASAWRIVEDRVAARSPCKFPSLLMLPLLALGGAGGRPLLRVLADEKRTVVSLQGLQADVSTELRQQIVARLRALYGQYFHIETTTQHQLAIILQPTVDPTGEIHA